MKIHQSNLEPSVGPRWPCASQAYSMTRSERKWSVDRFKSNAGFRGRIVNVHQLFHRGRRRGESIAGSSISAQDVRSGTLGNRK